MTREQYKQSVKDIMISKNPYEHIISKILILMVVMMK